MSPILQLNTGQLLGLHYAPFQALTGTLTPADNEIFTGNFQIPLLARDSVIRITFNLSVTFTVPSTAEGDEFMQIAIFRNDNPSQIFTGNYSLFPIESAGSINGLPVSFQVVIIDPTPRFGNFLTNEVDYNIRLQAINLEGDETVELLSLDVVSFEEIVNSVEVTIPNTALIPT